MQWIGLIALSLVIGVETASDDMLAKVSQQRTLEVGYANKAQLTQAALKAKGVVEQVTLPPEPLVAEVQPDGSVEIRHGRRLEFVTGAKPQ